MCLYWGWKNSTWMRICRSIESNRLMELKLNNQTWIFKPHWLSELHFHDSLLNKKKGENWISYHFLWWIFSQRYPFPLEARGMAGSPFGGKLIISLIYSYSDILRSLRTKGCIRWITNTCPRTYHNLSFLGQGWMDMAVLKIFWAGAALFPWAGAGEACIPAEHV